MGLKLALFAGVHLRGERNKGAARQFPRLRGLDFSGLNGFPEFFPPSRVFRAGGQYPRFEGSKNKIHPFAFCDACNNLSTRSAKKHAKQTLTSK